LKYSKGNTVIEEYNSVRSYVYAPTYDRNEELDELVTKEQLTEKFSTIHFTQAFFKLSLDARKEVIQGLNYMKNRFGEDALPKTLTSSEQTESYGRTNAQTSHVSLATRLDANNAFATTCHECMHVYDGKRHMISERIVPDTRQALKLKDREYDEYILDILGVKLYTLYSDVNTEILSYAFEEVLYGTENKFAKALIKKLES
jgi:hypothetical protein